MAPRTRTPPPAPLDIREVQTIKHERVFLTCDRYGDIPEGNTAALGLYFMDTRFLCQYELTIDGVRPLFLHAEADRNYSMMVETTLPVSIVDPHGVPRMDNVSVSRHRWLQAGMRELIRVRNYSTEKRQVTIEIVFHSDFRDLFEVRGWKRGKEGNVLESEANGDNVVLGYEGLDGVKRTLLVRFDPAPTELIPGKALYSFTLPPQGQGMFEVMITPTTDGVSPPDLDHEALDHEYVAWKKSCTRFKVSQPAFDSFIGRAVKDLRMMQTHSEDGGVAIDAGVPWFSALFGRDSLLTAYEALAVNPDLAKGTLRTLAALQGTKIDDARDEEPGKIPHELRVGEMANTGEIPHTPYYGSIDATPLWLAVYGYVWQWTADRDFISALWPHAVRALEWIDTYGDLDGDGYVEYRKKTPNGLDNQGWKDSLDGVLMSDGSKPEGPIALVEVQGYVYDAKIQVARVARALGHDELARDLEQQAAALKERFNTDFWVDESRYYGIALDGNKEVVDSVTSNPGHALWSGIIDAERAGAVVRRLLSPEMSCGWGIRTLSARNPAFDPIGYHTGSVWPHDNALIAHGMKRYGFDDESLRLLLMLANAGGQFRDSRFPELFCGFSREDAPVPVEYPVACRPQAWSSAVPLMMLRTFAGMKAQAPEGILSIVRPRLPELIANVDLVGMRVGRARIDMSFHQHAGTTGVSVLRKDGAPLDVVVRY